jgi:hypothetical protein
MHLDAAEFLEADLLPGGDLDHPRARHRQTGTAHLNHEIGKSRLERRAAKGLADNGHHHRDGA